MLIFLLISAACVGAIALGAVLVIVSLIEVIDDLKAKRRLIP